MSGSPASEPGGRAGAHGGSTREGEAADACRDPAEKGGRPWARGSVAACGPGSRDGAGAAPGRGRAAADRGQTEPSPRFEPLGAPLSVTPRRLVRLLASVADRLLVAAPGVVLPATALVARLASRFGLYGVAPDFVAAVVPGLDGRASRRVASAAAASTAVSGRLTRAIRGGHGEIASRLLDPGALAGFQRDVASLSRAILVSFHLGPFSAIRAALDQTGVRCLYLQMASDEPSSPGVEMVPEDPLDGREPPRGEPHLARMRTDVASGPAAGVEVAPEARPGGHELSGGEPHPVRRGEHAAPDPAGGPERLLARGGADDTAEARSASLYMGRDGDRMAAALWQARRWLDSGGVVVVLPDSGIGAPTDPVRCLGRLVTFSRGAFTLARLARVPLVPVRCRWARSAAPGVWTRVACLVECWPPAIAPPEDVRDAGRAWEAGAAEQLADRLDAWLTGQPEALNLEWIGMLARSPRAAISAGLDRGDPPAR